MARVVRVYVSWRGGWRMPASVGYEVESIFDIRQPREQLYLGIRRFFDYSTPYDISELPYYILDRRRGQQSSSSPFYRAVYRGLADRTNV